ncbi:MAG: nucleotidyltransferase family protein [Flavobacteriales bacterium]|nr:nucleotidyltransferase family protein [Flavobacteriales bacterium]
MSVRNEVLQKLQASLPELRSRFPIRSLALFGSVSRGEDGPESDVDVLVEFDGAVGMRFMHLAHELAGLLGRKVDLVSRGGIKPRYYQAIQPDLRHVQA